MGKRQEMLLPGFQPAGRWTHDDALQCLASCDRAPERDEQLACQRDDHGLVRASTAIGIAGPVEQCQCSELAMLLAASWAKRGF